MRMRTTIFLLFITIIFIMAGGNTSLYGTHTADNNDSTSAKKHEFQLKELDDTLPIKDTTYKADSGSVLRLLQR